MKIFVYEMKKILIKQYAIIILAAVVIVRLLSSLPLSKQTYGFDSATEREKYFEIISPFIGALTEEKTDRADGLVGSEMCIRDRLISVWNTKYRILNITSR